jgi:predicted HTH transcriptional regulator
MEVGLPAGKCEPWASYLATRTRDSLGMKGTEGLTELQKKVYEFIKGKGKTTREEVKQNLNLSEVEIDAQLTPLMHSELIKERGEGGNLYLVPIG